MKTAVRTTNSMKVIKGAKHYRIVGVEDEAEPMVAVLKRARQRFRQNVQMESGRYIPLENIRLTSIPANAEQSSNAPDEARAVLAKHLGENAELLLSLPYAVSGGRMYLPNSFACLDDEQTETFFEEELLPLLRELKVDPDELEPVFVPNRLG